MPGPVLPHAPALVPLLPVRPKPPQPQLASPLVELAAGKGGACRSDRPPGAATQDGHGTIFGPSLAGPRIGWTESG
jgi:hypothetical protein